MTTAAYWERRYADGGSSGDGSEGENAAFKAAFLNAFVAERGIRHVVEFGCGDGRQLALADYPRYRGLDVSETAVGLCRERFAGDEAKSFGLLPRRAIGYDLALSVDVIYHLTGDEEYELHLRDVFAAARRFVVLYTTDSSGGRDYPAAAGHVRHRPVTEDVAARWPYWRLVEVTVNPRPDLGGSDFYVYEPVR